MKHRVLISISLLFSALEQFYTEPAQVTHLDRHRYLFVLLRQVSLNGVFKNINHVFNENIKQGKVQTHLSDLHSFPCDIKNGRSNATPTSVDHIRPGDIDIIACIGDSLSAANGGISTNILDILNEFRSISFSGGGRANWRKYLTLPNILKVFNPNLYGYAISDVLTIHKNSRLNVAEPMVMSADLTFQVKTLIKRLQSDRHVNMKKHWKLLTMFVGNNDVCSDMCHHNPYQFLRAQENNLVKSLRMLRDNVPRLIVNVLPVPNMRVLIELDDVPMMCKIVHRIACHCFFSSRLSRSQLDKYFDLITKWQLREEQITKMQEFQKQDFAVIFHPFLANISMSSQLHQSSKMKFLASDCFHFSQLGHSMVANALWNSMMQPDGMKQTEMYPLFEKFECPTETRPFIATKYTIPAI